MKRFLSILLVAVMIVSSITLMDSAIASEASNAQLQYMLAESQNELYTELYLAKTGTYANTVVQSFVDKKGVMQYRMYGDLGGVKGYYPLNVLYNNATLNITASSRTPAQDTVNDLGIAKPDSNPAIVPQGYTALKQQGVYSIENIFDEKEICIRATYDGVNYVLVPAMLYEDFKLSYPTLAEPNYIQATKGSYVPRPGAIPYNMVDQLARSKASNGNKTYPMPAKYSRGISIIVDAVSTDGKTMTGVRTVGEELDLAAIRNQGKVKPAPTAKPQAKPTVKPQAKRPRAPRVTPRPGNDTNNRRVSSSIKKYQRKLQALGYFDSVVDGIYGPITRKAIKQFQKANGLKQTGTFDRATRRALNSNNNINARGNRVNPIVNVPSKSKKAIASVKNVYTEVAVARSRYLQGAYVHAYTLNGRNPSKINVKLTVDIINLDKNSQVATVSKNAMAVDCGVNINAPGNYRARVFASRGKGLVLKDYKDFKVYANNDGQSIPNDASKEEKKNDFWLSVNFDAKPVREGDVVNYTVKLSNTQNDHRYDIIVEPQNTLPTGAENVQNTGYAYAGSFTAKKAGNIPVKVTIITPSGKKYRTYSVKVYPAITDNDKQDTNLKAYIGVNGGKLVQNVNTILNVKLENAVFDNDYQYTVECDKPGVMSPAMKNVKYENTKQFTFAPSESGDYKFTITVVNKHAHTKTFEQIINVKESKAQYEAYDVVRTDNAKVQENIESTLEFKLNGAPQGANYALWATYTGKDGKKQASGKDRLVIPKFKGVAPSTEILFELYVNNQVVWSKTISVSVEAGSVSTSIENAVNAIEELPNLATPSTEETAKTTEPSSEETVKTVEPSTEESAKTTEPSAEETAKTTEPSADETANNEEPSNDKPSLDPGMLADESILGDIEDVNALVNDPAFAESKSNDNDPASAEGKSNDNDPTSAEGKSNDEELDEKPLKIVNETNQKEAKSTVKQTPNVSQAKAVKYTEDSFEIKTKLHRDKAYRAKKHRGKLYIDEKAKLEIEIIKAKLPVEEYRIDILVNGKLVKSVNGLSTTLKLAPEKLGKMHIEILAYNHQEQDHENFITKKLSYNVIEKHNEEVKNESTPSEETNEKATVKPSTDATEEPKVKPSTEATEEPTTKPSTNNTEENNKASGEESTHQPAEPEKAPAGEGEQINP